MLALDGKNKTRPLPNLAGQASSVCMKFGGGESENR